MGAGDIKRKLGLSENKGIAISQEIKGGRGL